MDVSLLNDAFKKLSILDEDVFTADDEGAEELDSFIDDSEKDAKDEITVADVSAEEDGDLEDSYIGKAVIDCTVCHSKLFKDVADVQIDETSGLANVDEECPYCTSTDGYNVIGIIGEYSNNAEDTDNTDASDEEVEEGLLTRDINVNLDAHNFGGSNNDVSVLSPGNLLGGNKDVNEGLLSRDVNLNVDAHEFGGNGNNVSVLGGNAPAKEDLDNSVECDESKCRDKKSHIKSGMRESFDSVEIVKDGEKIEIKSEPAEEGTYSGEEVIEPLDDATKEEIVADDEETEDEEDIDIDEVSEKELDELGESYLRSIYENVKSYRTNKATISGNKLKLEGIITFKSGNRKNTAFLFESKEITRRGKLKFIGENCQITKNKKAFTLVGNMQGNKFIAESLNYNYHAMNNKKPVRVYGTKRISK